MIELKASRTPLERGPESASERLNASESLGEKLVRESSQGKLEPIINSSSAADKVLPQFNLTDLKKLADIKIPLDGAKKIDYTDFLKDASANGEIEQAQRAVQQNSPFKPIQEFKNQPVFSEEDNKKIDWKAAMEGLWDKKE